MTLDIALTINVITNLIFELSAGVIIAILGRIAFDAVSAEPIPTVAIPTGRSRLLLIQ
ncbi:hypothetical protein [Viridibacillus arvi]|uniref:hypothetical protein n=1 Tax=Viridibacillus arvi TaxID=263475 RepID=UPI0012EE2751|nr:hypothetical protein [Viridibacillus arvi]